MTFVNTKEYICLMTTSTGRGLSGPEYHMGNKFLKAALSTL